MAIVKETFGFYCLTIERDAKRRVVFASEGGMELVCQPDVPSGKLSSRYGDEQWADGRLTGSWLDLPYGHECAVDRLVAYDAWVRECLSQLRQSVFCCGEKGSAPSGKRAREVMLYARKHKLLSESLINPSAEVTLKNALPWASESEKVGWRRWFKRDGLKRYLEILGSKK
jgi:hypothetical protein